MLFLYSVCFDRKKFLETIFFCIFQCLWKMSTQAKKGIKLFPPFLCLHSFNSFLLPIPPPSPPLPSLWLWLWLWLPHHSNAHHCQYRHTIINAIPTTITYLHSTTAPYMKYHNFPCESKTIQSILVSLIKS